MARALAHYLTDFPEPGSGAGIISEGPAAWLPGHLDAGACVSTETQKDLGSGPVCRPTGVP